jgi:hypothetical protein
MIHIPLTKGRRAVIDDEDYYRVSRFKWSYTQNGSNGYAIHASNAGRFYLHRFLMNAGKGDLIDHINGDSLDNRRSNLRICDKSVNNRNRKNVKGYSKHTSRYKTKNGDRRIAVGWVAETKLKDKRIRRYFTTEQGAKEFAASFTRR